MSKKAKAKKKRKAGGGKSAPRALSKAEKEKLAKPGKGKTARNWSALKERYLRYDFLTYVEMAEETGIAKNQIEKRAAVRKEQPETWKDERTRRTKELSEASHERAKREAAGLNAKLREELLSNANTLEVVGQRALVNEQGEVAKLTPREGIAAVGEASRIKQGLIGAEPKAPAQPRGFAAGGSDAGNDEDEQGIIVLPQREAGEAWQKQQQERVAKK